LKKGLPETSAENVNLDGARSGDDKVDSHGAHSIDGKAISHDSHTGDEKVNQNGAFRADEGALTFRSWWLSGILYVLFSLLKWTWQKSEDAFPAEIQKRLEEKKPVLVAHWHEDEWALLGLWSNRGAHTLVSLSKDGGAMTHFLELCGWRISRGSSSKGGATGLLSLIKAA
jgi:hypothetical protein